MTYEQERRFIIDASFFTKDGHPINFKKLPSTETFRVKGQLYASHEDFEADCTLNTRKELLINGEVYQFIPKNLHGIENAIEIHDTQYTSDGIFGYDLAEAKRRSTLVWPRVMAVGKVTGHYRKEDGTRIRTSPITKFYELDGKQYFDTANATYHIVS